MFFTDNAAVFNAALLKRFDAIVWNNVSGDVLTIAQRRDFKAYIENGGGCFCFCKWEALGQRGLHNLEDQPPLREVKLMFCRTDLTISNTVTGKFSWGNSRATRQPCRL